STGGGIHQSVEARSVGLPLSLATQQRQHWNMTQQTPPAVSVRGLRKRYGSFDAVAGVDFDIARGETFALLGPNGAGKSTTIEILEGYRDRTAGEVSVLGVDPRRGGLAWKARLGIVLQDSGESGNVTIREQLNHFAAFYPNPKPVDEVIAAVGLEAKAGTLIR